MKLGQLAKTHFRFSLEIYIYSQICRVVRGLKIRVYKGLPAKQKI